MTDELELKSIMVERSTWREAQKKAGVIPMSALIRKLLERYVEDEENRDKLSPALVRGIHR